MNYEEREKRLRKHQKQTQNWYSKSMIRDNCKTFHMHQAEHVRVLCTSMNSDGELRIIYAKQKGPRNYKLHYNVH